MRCWKPTQQLLKPPECLSQRRASSSLRQNADYQTLSSFRALMCCNQFYKLNAIASANQEQVLRPAEHALQSTSPGICQNSIGSISTMRTDSDSILSKPLTVSGEKVLPQNRPPAPGKKLTTGEQLCPLKCAEFRNPFPMRFKCPNK